MDNGQPTAHPPRIPWMTQCKGSVPVYSIKRDLNGHKNHGVVYAAMKKNKMLSLARKWMELENIILSEVSLAQKTKNCMFSLICGH
jgi:hypothetical protein